jgi:hypothetical protein
MSEPRSRLLDPVAAQLARVVGDARGRLVQEARHCGGCRVVGKPIWRFARVDAGELWLCPRCKVELESRRARGGSAGCVASEPRVRRRAGYVDAMARALHAGSFEANRRRH